MHTFNILQLKKLSSIFFKLWRMRNRWSDSQLMVCNLVYYQNYFSSSAVVHIYRWTTKTSVSTKLTLMQKASNEAIKNPKHKPLKKQRGFSWVGLLVKTIRIKPDPVILLKMPIFLLEVKWKSWSSRTIYSSSKRTRVTWQTRCSLTVSVADTVVWHQSWAWEKKECEEIWKRLKTDQLFF